jgi:hypothetical protein
MMSAKILLKILIFSAWLSLASGLSQSDKVGDTFWKMSYIFLKIYAQQVLYITAHITIVNCMHDAIYTVLENCMPMGSIKHMYRTTILYMHVC